MQPDVDTSGDQPDPTPTNTRSSIMIDVKLQIQILMTNTDIESAQLLSTARTRTLSGYPRNVLWNSYAKPTYFSNHLAVFLI